MTNQPGGAPLHASYSSVDTWQQCGLKYKLTRIDRHKEEPAWWSVGGSAVHTATEWHDLGADASPAMLFAKAFTSETERQAEYTETDPKSWRSSRNQDGEWWIKNGAGMVESWVQWREATGWDILDIPSEDPDHIDGVVPGVEVPFEVECAGIPVKGYIDRVFVTPTGEVVIVDLKTGARKPSSALQLGYYRVGLARQYGLTADLGGYWMSRKKPGEQCAIEGLTMYSPEYIDRMVAGFEQARKAELYLPHITSFCGSCTVAQHCWAMAGVEEDSDATSHNNKEGE